MTQTPAIGIDFGTTYISVGVYNHGKVEIIPTEDGNRRIASFVSFGQTQRVAGDNAMDQFLFNPENTICHIKRLIGRAFNEKTIELGRRLWPFKIYEHDGRLQLAVTFQKKEIAVDPELIAGALLAEMKKMAEKYLKKSVSNAVISVPANFTDSQRQALLNAGKMANLNIMKFISDPAAISLAYGLDKVNENMVKVLLVYDFGGGTCEVSIVTISQGQITVKATAGITHFGGEDMDARLMTFVIGEFQRQHQKNPKQSKIAIAKLKLKIESLKKKLSSNDTATLHIDSFFEGKKLVSKISRHFFEELCADLFKLNIEFIDKVLQETNYHKNDIDEVIMVGGSVKIPKVQSLMQQYFAGKKLNISINPDEAVTYGAVLQAATLAKDESIPHDITVNEIYAGAVSIDIPGLISTVLLPKFSRIPIRNMQYISKTKNKETSITIKVYEGDHKLIKYNNILGTFVITDIEQGTSGENKIEAVFEMNAYGVLNIRATEVTQAGNRILPVRAKKNCRSIEDVDDVELCRS